MDLEDLLNTPDTTEQFEVRDIEENKMYSLCAYLSILFLVPLLVRPDSKFARFHTNQGIVLFIVSIAVGIVIALLSAVLALIPLIGDIVAWIVGTALGLAVLSLIVIGIINSATGKAKELPVVGNIRILK